MDVDFAQEKMEVFRQAWTYMRDGFYDDKFHGVDWDAVRATYAPRIAGAQTPDEMRRLLNLMVGELNASHMGVGGGGRGGAGRRRAGGGAARAALRSARVRAQRPAEGHRSDSARAGGGLAQVAAGDYLVAVDGTPVGARPTSTSCCRTA